MRKFGNYITASPPIPSTSANTGTYETTEIHSLATNNTLQTYPSVSNYNLVSSNGYGISAYGGYGRNDGVYSNTTFYFSLNLSNIPSYLVNNAYIITLMYRSSGKSAPYIYQSGVANDGNYDFSGNDYDVLTKVSLLTSATTYTSPTFRALWTIAASTKAHQVAFYLSSSNSTSTGTAFNLGAFPMFKVSTSLSSTFSSSSVQEGSNVTQTIYANTNGRASASATLRNTYSPNGTAVAADVSNMYDTSYTVSSAGTATTRTVTAVSDGVTEGTESVFYNIEAYSPALAAWYTQYPGVSAFSITDPPPPPAFITSGNKAPILGAGGTTWIPAGYTGLQDLSVDDNFVTVPLGFTFYMAGAAYTTAYMGSNTYLTFGSGSSNYSGLSASNPPYPKFAFGAADNSYQRVAYKQSAGNWCKIRYEGNGSTSGTSGSPGITLEITLYNPAFLGTSFYVCEVLIGGHNRPSVLWGAYSGSALYDNTGGYSANTSHVFVSTDTTGSGWKQWANYYVSTATS